MCKLPVRCGCKRVLWVYQIFTGKVPRSGSSVFQVSSCSGAVKVVSCLSRKDFLLDLKSFVQNQVGIISKAQKTSVTWEKHVRPLSAAVIISGFASGWL